MTISDRENNRLFLRQKKQVLCRRNNWRNCFFRSVTMFFLLILVGITGIVPVKAAEKNIPFREFPIASIWNTGITQTGINLPLRSFLSKAVPRGTSFFIDRRIDPATPVSVSFENTPFLKGVESLLSDELGLEIFVLDNILYVGPKKSAGTLMFLIHFNRRQLEKTDSALTDNLLKKSSLDISYASTSHDILTKLAQEGKNLHWNNLKRFPFDCWDESKLPPLPLIDQITLVLVGFDCRLEIDNDQKELNFIRCQNSEKLELLLPKNKLKNFDPQIPANCQKEEVSSRPGFVRIFGPMEDLVQLESQMVQHQQDRYLNSAKGSVARKTTAEKKGKISGKKKIISGKVENSDLEHLFIYLQKNLNVTFRLDVSLAAKGISSKTRVSCSFDESDASEAAKKIADELKVQFRWEDNNICFY